jgi:hypothetical protein
MSQTGERLEPFASEMSRGVLESSAERVDVTSG